MANKAATGVWLVDKSLTQASGGAVSLVCAENPSRGAVFIQNTGSGGTAYIVFNAAGAAAPSSITAGSSGVIAITTGSFLNLGGSGWVPCNAIYTAGTSADRLVCYETQNA